ncbi:MAG: beta-galactosidase, partial [Candidatus Competibacteraceae bacterium]|nr:beta-galactosidase [Candidatus Competibacteraceae bacterium]
APGEARLWRLDRYLRVVPAPDDRRTTLAVARQSDFSPLGGEVRELPGRHFPLGTALGTAASPVEVAEPVAIVALADDSLLILESDSTAKASTLHRYRHGQPRDVIPLEGQWLADLLASPQIMAHDMAFIGAPDDPPGRISGELTLVARDGNQAFALGLVLEEDHLSLFLRPRYLPLRRFTGKALVAAGDEVLYDQGQRWLPLAALPRRRFYSQAVLEDLVLDGHQPDTLWHRLLLDGVIPPGDRIIVESRTADRRELLEESPWQTQPPLYRRHAPELPYHNPFTPRELECPGTGTWELLLQNPRGRFLELRLTLQGSGRSTPRLRALRVWYPRFSYLSQYLPAAYGDDPLSADFLERWLANPEGLFTTLEGMVANAQQLLDSRTAPAEYLDWLAGWLGALLDPDWDEARRRLFIDHIELLFRWRGTPLGLLTLIRLDLEPCPDARLFDQLRQGQAKALSRFGGRSVRLVEGFQTRRFPGVSLGDPRRLEQPGVIDAEAPYRPTQGPGPLHERFRTHLRRRYTSQTIQERWGQPLESLKFPPLLPDDQRRAADWRAFIESRLLGFTYAVVDGDDQSLFQGFLARRYRLIDALNQAYGLTEQQRYSAFEAIPLPQQLPEHPQRLADWIGFVSLTVPIERNAHRFIVLVPTDPEESESARQRRLERVRGIVAREKPAHTRFDVQPFWALFQVGGARLGLDTILGEGSRYTALVLGADHLGGGYLAPSHPMNARDRRVVGRDAPGDLPLENPP